MNKLIAELLRLHFLPASDHPAGPAEGALSADSVAGSLEGGAPAALDLVSADGKARAMVVGFERGADWEQLAGLCHGVQEDLHLPAPAVSVSGKDGYQVWFSLAEAVPAEQARGFLKALRRKYLAEIPAASLNLRPDPGEPAAAEPDRVDLVPALHAATGKWSAFIDPNLGRMFMDEPGLDMAPNLDRQADLLAGFASITTGEFQRALRILQPHADPAPGAAAPSPDSPREGATPPGPEVGSPRPTLSVGSNFSDPKSFLLAVMNDPAARARDRIKAATALLPYFDRVPPQ